MNDMLLLNLPWADLLVPSLAPALLKGIAESHGYKIKTVDLCLDFRDVICQGNQSLFEQQFDYFLSTDTQDKNFYAEQFYEYAIKKIQKESFRYLGISVFSVWTQKTTLELCELLKEKIPEIKIVLGGRGLSTSSYSSVFNRLTPTEKFLDFGQIMTKRKLADHVILGDGEDAIIDLLRGSELNSFQHTAKINDLKYPFPNFDDYQLDRYSGILGRPQLISISSKGCVRACDFCDVGVQFSKFQSKDGYHFANEIIHLSNKYGIKEFATADSILNGNLKSLRKTLEKLAEYNESVEEDQKISWGGNWICRPRNVIKPDFFNLMKRAGCSHLNIGAESGSDRVLEAMIKKTTVDGLIYEIDQMFQNNIQCGLNNIIGHWSEHYDDFMDHIETLIKLGPMYANRTITQLTLGSGFSVLKGTPAALSIDVNGLVLSRDNFSFLWYSTKNPNLTMKSRLARLYIIYQICLELKIPIFGGYSSLLNLVNRLEENFDYSLEFYKKHADQSSDPCQSLYMMDDFKKIIKEKITKNFSDTTIELHVQSESFNGNPMLFVEVNGEIRYRESMPDGDSFVKIKLDYENECNTIRIGMEGKNINDTLVDENNKILKDKKILFKKLSIDNIDIMKDEVFFYSLPYYENGKKIDTVYPGFFRNGFIEIKFQSPFWRSYFQKRSDPKHYSVNSDIELIHKMLEKVREISDRYHF